MSGLIDRFVCRREGHIPAFSVTRMSGITVKSWTTSCVRCGKVYEVVQAAPEGEALTPNQETDTSASQ